MRVPLWLTTEVLNQLISYENIIARDRTAGKLGIEVHFDSRGAPATVKIIPPVQEFHVAEATAFFVRVG